MTDNDVHDLILNPAPTIASNDAVDGILTVNSEAYNQPPAVTTNPSSVTTDAGPGDGGDFHGGSQWDPDSHGQVAGKRRIGIPDLRMAEFIVASPAPR